MIPSTRVSGGVAVDGDGGANLGNGGVDGLVAVLGGEDAGGEDGVGEDGCDHDERDQHDDRFQSGDASL